MRHLLREKRGLTLAEVLLASAIISVAVLAIIGLFPTALQNVRYGGHMSQASSLAQEIIELIRTRPFAEVSSYNNLDTRLPAPGGLPAPVLAHFTRWKNDIAPVNPAGALPQGWGTVQVVETALGLADLKQVTITVGWRESGNQTITIVTYVARYG
ncbi:MAG: type IV pilus modification PilV family protein [Candidatus Methylomirabilales bacterium]